MSDYMKDYYAILDEREIMAEVAADPYLDVPRWFPGPMVSLCCEGCTLNVPADGDFVDMLVSQDLQDMDSLLADFEANDTKGEDDQSFTLHMGIRKQVQAIDFTCYQDRNDGFYRSAFSRSKNRSSRIRKVQKPDRIKPLHKR